LALTFSNPSDYDKIREQDRLTISNINDFREQEPLHLLIHHADGVQETISLAHSYNASQINWFRAGGALNLIASR
jgi:aconitate hydratase